MSQTIEIKISKGLKTLNYPSLKTTNSKIYITIFVIIGLTSGLLLINYNKMDKCEYARARYYQSLNESLNYTEFNAPVIGIITQSLDGTLKQDEFISAGYVKFIESGGGRVIPIRFTMDEDELENIFQKINGLLVTGGHQKLYRNVTTQENIIRRGHDDQIEVNGVEFTRYQLVVTWFLERAEAAAELGDYFPIFAICLGHEALLFASEPHYNTIQKLDTNITYHSPLNIVTRHVFENPRSFWYDLPDHLKTIMQTERIFYYHHKFGTPKDWYDKSPTLKRKFAPLTYAKDNQNRTFITSYQHRSLPIYAVQFHPEKNAFEWKSDSNKQPQALAISNYLANFFIEKCRKNQHKFQDNFELSNYIIYNYDQSRHSELFSSVFVIPKKPEPICQKVLLSCHNYITLVAYPFH